MWHTLTQATQLTGRSRRSLYRDMDAGRVSYRVRDDGRRELETSELIRAYGPLRGLARVTVPEVAQADTPDGTPYAALLDELRLLREEVAGLRAELRLIEHKPSERVAIGEAIEAELDGRHGGDRRSETAEDQEGKFSTLIEGKTRDLAAKSPKPAQSFADLLAGLGD